MRPTYRRPPLIDVAVPRLRPRARDVGAAALQSALVAVAIIVCAALATVLLVLLLTVAAPLGALLLAWIAWRSDRVLTGALARLRARWGRSARVIAGGLDVEDVDAWEPSSCRATTQRPTCHRSPAGAIDHLSDP